MLHSNASSSGSAGYSLLLMEAVSTTRPESPLAQLLRARTQEVLSSWEASGEMPASEPGRTALRRFLSALDELAEAAEALATPRKEALVLVPKPPILTLVKPRATPPPPQSLQLGLRKSEAHPSPLHEHPGAPQSHR